MNVFARAIPVIASLSIGCMFGAGSRAQGLMPVPDVSGATVRSRAVLVSGFPWGGEYEYRYTITNPASATGAIWLLKVDISAQARAEFNRSIRTFPVRGGSSTAPMKTEADLLQPFFGRRGSEVLLVKQLAPTGWDGGLNVEAFAQFSAADMSFAIGPGTTMGGFIVSFPRPPTIREFSMTPHWVLEVEDHSQVTEQDLEEAFTIERSLPVTSYVLGPLDIEVGGRPHYRRLSEDIRRAETLGWVTDAALVDELDARVFAALNHVRDENNGLALEELQAMLALVGTVDPPFREEFRDLVQLNVDVLIQLLPSAFNSFIPVFTATPERAELLRGDTFSLTMRHFNSALEGNPPIANLNVLVRCVADFPCANIAQLESGTAFRLDETGEAVFNYVGGNDGIDRIEVVRNDFESFEQLALIEVNWTANVDMIVPAFVPPMILAGEGDTVFITDRTSNIGTVGVDLPTKTTYYISDTSPVDIDIATVLGARDVPSLAAGGFNDSIETPFAIPEGFTGEIQFLAACADSGNIVVESDESNNCSFSEITREFDPVMVVPDPNASLPTISVADAAGAEGDIGQQELVFEVALSASDPLNSITVTLTTDDGTAVAGVDYEDTSVAVVFPAGTSVLTQSVPIAVFGDFDVELDESFSAQLSGPSPNARIGIGSATGTIENDDLTTVTVGDVSALEGDAGSTVFAFPIMIDQPHPTEDIVVSFRTVDGSAQAGSDYVAAAATVSFAVGTTDLSKHVIVDVLGDETVESDEDFSLTITSLSPNALTIDGQGIGKILNDDAPPELDCSTVTATPSVLWPPNHKLVRIALNGVFDLNNDPARIVITAIQQDEDVNGLGDGDTGPDGFGLGTSSAEVRRERSGTSDGRVYLISFRASDDQTAASCTGIAVVGVPHDQGNGSIPVDSGLRFDSTMP